jgi:cytochrome c-type biogenesis protein CcmH
VAQWRALLAELPVKDPRHEALKAAIAEAEAPSARAPIPADPGGQAEMIRNMVAGLAARLEQTPDDAEGWVRLVRSYAVLGQADARDAALAKAKARYAAQPDVLAKLQAAAKTPPMAPAGAPAMESSQ